MSPQILVIYREADRVGPYRDAAISAGLTPVLMQAGKAASLDGMAGLLLTGGTDVNPMLYGEPALPETDEPDAERDALEMSLTGEAIDRNLPILAICRGMQLLNVWHGGTLVQHLPTFAHHRQPTGDRAEAVHQVKIEAGTLLAEIIGAETCGVNSRHHQSVKSLGKGLKISAIDPEDGVIEAFERPDSKFVVAVQWHPEDQVKYPEHLQLFKRFSGAMR